MCLSRGCWILSHVLGIINLPLKTVTSNTWRVIWYTDMFLCLKVVMLIRNVVKIDFKEWLFYIQNITYFFMCKWMHKTILYGHLASFYLRNDWYICFFRSMKKLSQSSGTYWIILAAAYFLVRTTSIEFISNRRKK